MDKDCIFCRIVAGEIPSVGVCEDDRTVAFMDINPANRGHVLVVPKAHGANIFEVAPEDLAAAALMAQRVAQAVQAAMAPDGINLLQANGPGAAQSVPHFHLHVLPRRLADGLAMNWSLHPGNRDDIRAAAEAIRDALIDASE